MKKKRSSPYNTIDYWLEQVKAQGFPARTAKDIDQAILTIYHRTRSMQKTARILKVSVNTIRNHLFRLESPILSRGGNNNPVGNGGRGRRLLTYHGKTQSLTAWGRELGIHPMTICTRLNQLGWSVEQALTTPVNRAKSRKRNCHRDTETQRRK